jgi:hypothetical protein
MGCYSDNVVIARTLARKATAGSTMCTETCAAFCSGFTYFGTEYGDECYCSNVIATTGQPVTDGRCSMVCAANTDEICGGSYGLSMYMFPSLNFSSPTVTSSTATSSFLSVAFLETPTTSTSLTSSAFPASESATPTPSIPAVIGQYTYLHCHSDNTTIRTLQAKYVAAQDMTLELCAKSCTGYAYFGVEYMQECYCGNSLTYGSYTATDGRCDMLCGGALEICGGGDGLTLYQNTTLLNGGPPSISSSRNSVSSSSATTFGISIPSSVTATSSSQSLSLSLSSTSRSLTTLTASILSSTSGLASATLTPGWTPLGCANDTVTSRALGGATYSNATGMTIESCQAYCNSVGYSLAGLEYASECYCGGVLGFGSFTGFTGCTMLCSGNKSEICGGSTRLSVYNNTAFIAPKIVRSLAGTVGTYKYQGCYTELTNARALSNYEVTSLTLMSAEYCVSTCSGKGYAYAGLEYGSQCFCGSTLAIGSSLVSDSQCQVMLCPGTKSEYCSAGYKLIVYLNS